MATITWKQLGSPTRPGDVLVKGLGIIHVSPEDIDRVQQLGQDNPVFTLSDASIPAGPTDRYVLESMR